MDEIKGILKDLVSDQQTIKNQMVTLSGNQQTLSDQMLTVTSEQKYLKDQVLAVLNGQHTLRQEFDSKFAESDKKTEALRSEMQDGFKKVDKRFDKVEARLDTLGKQLAYLEDDAPTREEHTALEKRVEKIEAN
jgi:hypothetical protein